MQLSKDTAVRIIDALALSIDKKPASAKTFASKPADETSFENWQNASYATKQDSTRTKALVLAYTMFSGGKLPKEGIRIDGAWFHPDIWVVKAMLNNEYLVEAVDGAHFELTSKGWALIAETLEGLVGKQPL